MISSSSQQLRLTMVSLFMAIVLAATSHAQAADHSPYHGQVVVITGSSSGLGKVLSEQLAQQGARLVLADINLGPSAAMAKQIEADGGAAVAVQVDLADPAQRPRVLQAAMDKFGRVDYLFNNAGYGYMATLEQHDLAMAHRLFEVNYWAYVDLANRVIPIMKAQGGGTIVNVASILGHRAAPAGMGVYSASKHALVGIFQTAAAELAADNIRVRIISPGGMKTKITKDAVGPMADAYRDAANSWEDPAIAVADILRELPGDAVVIYPGYVGREMAAGEG